MSIDDKLLSIGDKLKDFSRFHKDSIPLCAAENVISNFCKIPLNGDLQERYIMGNYMSYEMESNFIGSQFLLPIYKYIQEQCELLFGAKYSDARTLSGMNCLTTVLMSLTNLGDKIAILSSEWGGHPSTQAICERLGLDVYHLPYDKKIFDIDYNSANKLLESEDIRFILLAPSDIISPISIEKLNLNCRELLYDVSQIMGLISGKVIASPLTFNENIVMFGGTHKTLPGPTSGLILTNNDEIHERLDRSINPLFLRNTQMHQVTLLLFALLEMEEFGSKYSHAIIKTANELGTALEKQGFTVGKVSGKYSLTHQVFIFCSVEEMNRINNNAIFNGVTLNKKQKLLFDNSGIRFGVQEIARYGWNGEAIDIISRIIKELVNENHDTSVIASLKKQLPTKIPIYTFSEDQIGLLLSRLHEE
jgi:glycine/serine hydroxymethyltransferase